QQPRMVHRSMLQGSPERLDRTGLSLDVGERHRMNLLTCSARTPPSTLTGSGTARILAPALGAPTAPEPFAARRLRGRDRLPRRAPGAERRPSVQAGPARVGLAPGRLSGPADGGPLQGRAADLGAAPGARARLDAGPHLRLHPAHRLAAAQGGPA